MLRAFIMDIDPITRSRLETWALRPVSYSQLSSWDYDKEKWYNKYIMGIDEPANPAMLFGNTVGDTLGLPHSMVPQLRDVPGIKEYKMMANLGGITLIGYADHYCPEKKVLNENKTSQNKKRWTKKTVEEHTQLDMYALLLFLQNKTKPDDVIMHLNYIPVIENQDFTLSLPDPIECYTFTTGRTAMDITRYANYIQNTLKEMIEYAKHR